MAINVDMRARNDGALSRREPEIATALLAALALVKFLAHVLTSGSYGYFRDELYFIAASKHLDFGYVDFPPLVAAVGALVRATVGESQLTLHTVSAIAGAALVIVTGLIARELGGGRFAQGLAALATLVAPTFLGIDSLFSMNPFDELWWGLGAYLVLLIVKRQQPRLWLLLGLIVGIGLLTKVTMVYFACGVVVAFLLTPNRVWLRRRWPWLAALLAGAMFLPYIGWQVAHGWPSLDFWRNYSGDSDPVSPPAFLIVQMATMNFVAVPLWLAGLYFYFFSAQGRPYRLLGWIYVILYVLYNIIHAKYYFLAPAYPMLFAGGAVAFEQGIIPLRRLKQAYVVALTGSGIVLAIITLPVLPPATLEWATSPVKIAGNLGIHDEGRIAGQLPQPFADRFGWDTLTRTVARVYDKLPPTDRAAACILARNYGEAGAIELYGPIYHLPRVISGHDNYYLWGPGTCAGTVVIGVGWPRHSLADVFADVRQVAVATCTYCMRYESRLPVYVCRRPKIPFKAAWPRFKVYYAEWTV